MLVSRTDNPHNTSQSVDVQNMSTSDIGPILWMSARHYSNIPIAETEIQGMSFFKFLPALASATGCSTINNHCINKHNCTTIFGPLKTQIGTHKLDWQKQSFIGRSRKQRFLSQIKPGVLSGIALLILRRLTDSLKVEKRSDVHLFSRINLTLFGAIKNSISRF